MMISDNVHFDMVFDSQTLREMNIERCFIMSEKTLGQIIGIVEAKTKVTPKGNDKGIGAIPLSIKIDFTQCTNEEIIEYCRGNRIINFVNSNFRNTKGKSADFIKSFDGKVIVANSGRANFGEMSVVQKAEMLKSTLSAEEMSQLKAALGIK